MIFCRTNLARAGLPTRRAQYAGLRPEKKTRLYASLYVLCRSGDRLTARVGSGDPHERRRPALINFNCLIIRYLISTIKCGLSPSAASAKQSPSRGSPYTRRQLVSRPAQRCLMDNKRPHAHSICPFVDKLFIFYMYNIFI